MEDRLLLINRLEENASLLTEAWTDRIGKEITEWMLNTAKDLCRIESHREKHNEFAMDLQLLCQSITSQDDSDSTKTYGQYHRDYFR